MLIMFLWKPSVRYNILLKSSIIYGFDAMPKQFIGNFIGKRGVEILADPPCACANLKQYISITGLSTDLLILLLESPNDLC